MSSVISDVYRKCVYMCVCVSVCVCIYIYTYTPIGKNSVPEQNNRTASDRARNLDSIDRCRGGDIANAYVSYSVDRDSIRSLFCSLIPH